MNKRTKIIIIIAVIAVIVVLLSILGFKIWKDQSKAQNIELASNTSELEENIIEENIIEEEPKKEEIKKVQIYSGDERPIAVMIDNHKGAWPQAGLDKAYLVYEIIVEGGETRLMALFKGQDIENIGPVRSSRHYFLDYALENDAIYVHYGWSPKAQQDIKTLSVNNINGIYYDSPNFRRVKTKSAPHNVMTSTDKILKLAESLKYRTTSTVSSVLNYTTDDVTLDDGIDATSVTIPHSYLHKVQYKYDEDTGRYVRYARGTLQKDYMAGESITTKNIIIEFVNNSALNDGTNKDRQNLNNIGTFNGYYITNGKAIKITCTKSTRTSKTVYKDLEGNIIDVNDGNTWINICPKNAEVEIE